MERAIPLLLISERHEGPCSALVARWRQRGDDGDGRNCSVRGLARGGPLSAQKASSLSAASCLPRVGAVAAIARRGTRQKRWLRHAALLDDNNNLTSPSNSTVEAAEKASLPLESPPSALDCCTALVGWSCCGVLFWQLRSLCSSVLLYYSCVSI